MSGSIDDLFPPSDREVYEAAPLVEVVCEFRFPRLLAIETAVPAAFQERIRGGFPFLEANQIPGISSANLLSMPKEYLQMLNAQISTPAYKFMNETGESSVSLTSEMLTVSSGKYTEWKDFKKIVADPLSALVEIYKPAFFTRIGLRYMDMINRTVLGLEGKKWTELIRDGVLGAFAFPTLEANIEDVKHEIRVRLPDESGFVTFRHGFGKLQNMPGTSYFIDFDFYKLPRIEVDNATNIIDHFNTLSGRAFRACIRPELRTALRPRPLP